MSPDLIQFGVAGLMFAIAWKVLDKVPGFTNGTHKVTQALVDLSKSMKRLAEQSAEQTGYLRELHEAHLGYDSRRPDNSYRWHNSAAREADIEETRQLVGEVHGQVVKNG